MYKILCFLYFLSQYSYKLEISQLILKGLFWCLQIYQKTKDIFVRISALASKKVLSQKSMGTLLYYLNSPKLMIKSALIFFDMAFFW